MSAFDRYIRSTTLALERLPKDLFLAGAVGIIQLCATLMIGHDQDGRESIDALAIALVLAGPAALYWRGRAPVLVMIGTLAPALAYWALDYPRGPVWLAAIVAFVSAVFMGRRVPAWILLGVAWAGLVFIPHLVGDASPPTLGKAIGIAVWLFLLGEFAEIARSKRERHLEQERAEREKAAAQAGQERLLIARELHDVLAHNVSLINVQAGVALHLLDEQPERARPGARGDQGRELRDAARDALRARHPAQAGRAAAALADRRRRRPRRADRAHAGCRHLGRRARERLAARRCRPASTSPSTGSCRRRSRTSPATPASAAALVRLAYADESIEIVVDDDGLRAHEPNGYGGNGTRGHARARRRARRRVLGRAAPGRRLPGARAAAAGRRRE